MDEPVVTGIGVYLTKRDAEMVLLTEDHEVVFGTPDNAYAWTRDGEPNTPDTRERYGKLWRKIYDLVPAAPMNVDP